MGNLVGVIPFKLGESTDTGIPLQFREFYERVGVLTVGSGSLCFVGGDSARTICIRQSAVKSDQTIYDLTISSARSLSDTSDYLIIDLANPPREDYPITSIIRGIVTALSEVWWKNEKKRPAVLLTHQPISVSEFAYKVMSPHINRGEMVVIDSRGAVHGTLPARSFKAADYSAALQEVQDNPMTLMQRRLIRRIGHFRHQPLKDSRATKFYFDARECSRQIAELLLSSNDWSPSKQLFYHGPISPWLVGVANNFGLKRNGRRPNDLAEWIGSGHGPTKEPDVKIQSRPNVLVPMVDTGKTLRQIDKFLKRYNPQCKPTYVSVLSTSGDGEPSGTRSVSTKSASIDVRYLLKVKQVDFDKTSQPTCMLHHIGSNLEAEQPTLTSYAFWQMVDEVGFKEEEDVPRPRKPLGFVPRFPELLQNNGPLLAHKIKTILTPIPVDTVLICADEIGAIALTRCIRGFVTCSTIRIPRPVIDKIPISGNLQNLRERIKKQFGVTEWHKRLVSASSNANTRAILIDEFSSSGGTFLRLSRICACLNLTVERSIVLADFGIETSMDTTGLNSLYRLPLGGFP